MRPLSKATAEQRMRGMKKINEKMIDIVSDVMSYPARRKAQKSMIESDKRYMELKTKNMEKDKKMMQMQALENAKKTLKKPEMSQRDQYERAMNRAIRKGGSNGVGVGK